MIFLGEHILEKLSASYSKIFTRYFLYIRVKKGYLLLLAGMNLCHNMEGEDVFLSLFASQVTLELSM